MSLRFEAIDVILKEYGLVSLIIKNGECTEYAFEDKVIRHRNVASQVKSLYNGDVGGYFYINHLVEFDNHPNKTKMGHIPMRRMTDIEFRDTLIKVIKDYK